MEQILAWADAHSQHYIPESNPLAGGFSKVVTKRCTTTFTVKTNAIAAALVTDIYKQQNAGVPVTETIRQARAARPVSPWPSLREPERCCG